jgi:prephenate dehydrogenase
MDKNILHLRKVCLSSVDVVSAAIVRSFRRYGYRGTIYGIDESEAIKRSWAAGIVTDGSCDCHVGMHSCELVILSQSCINSRERLATLLEIAEPETIILDCSTVKGHEEDVFSASGRHDVHYIGFHLVNELPAGLTLNDATPFFFDHKALILTPRDKQDYPAFHKLAEVFRTVGANVIAMSPKMFHLRLAETEYIPDLLDLIQLETVLGEEGEEKIQAEYLGVRLNRRLQHLTGLHQGSWYDAMHGCQEPIDQLLEQAQNAIKQLREDLRSGTLRARVAEMLHLGEHLSKGIDTSNSLELFVVTRGDSKVIQHIAQVLAQARLKISELQPLPGNTNGAYKLTMGTAQDRERATQVLASAGIEIETTD